MNHCTICRPSTSKRTASTASSGLGEDAVDADLTAICCVAPQPAFSQAHWPREQSIPAC